jgi:hypothetical protein
MVLRSVSIGGALVVLLGGCGSEGKLAPVSGTVTLNGKPTAGIAVTLQPMATEENNTPGPSAFGVTDSNGRYTTTIVGPEKRAGATVGKNQVRFNAYIDPADILEDGSLKKKPNVQVPARYWSESKIEFDVPPKGTSSADFQLTSP